MGNRLMAFLAMKGITDQDTIDLLKEWGSVCVYETVETAKHHVDGEIDHEGTSVNSKKWLGIC